VSPTTVFVHGGMHASWCWRPVMERMNGDVLAVDLPGRPEQPAELRNLRVSAFVDAVVDAIDTARLDDVVLVGHSIAGVTLPRVVQRLGDRVRHVVFVSCVTPPLGRCVLDMIPGWCRPYLEYRCRKGLLGPSGGLSLPRHVARVLFCNDMDRDLGSSVLDRLVPEAPRALFEPTTELIDTERTPTTWIRLTRDIAVPPWVQDAMALRLGVRNIRDLQAGHDAMLSRPAQLAGLLSEAA
jgi:pimeloyl-ACP methyl ester carboxylesterase